MAITAERLQVEVGADTSEADRKLNDLGHGASSGWGSMLKTAGVAAFAAVGAAGVAIVGTGVKIAADMEQAEISFTTMLGSGEKAKAFLDELKGFAEKTPFEFPELQTAASSLISAGFEASKVIPIMTTLGDVTSGMGTGSEGVKRATVALQQMSAAGKITGEDLNQLRDAGVPVFDLLAAATGKSKDEIAAMAQAGKLGKKEMEALFTALESGKGLEKFNGLMEKQSQSLTGLLSSLKDKVGQSLAGMMGPVVGELKSALPQVTDVIGTALEAVGPSLTGLASGLIDALKAILPSLVPYLGAVAETIGQLFTQLAPVVAQLLPAFLSINQAVLPVLPALMSILVAMTPVIIILANAFAALINAIPVPILTAIAGALLLWLGPITTLTAAVMGLALVASFLIDHWSAITGFFGTLWETVKSVFSGAVSFITDNIGTAMRVVLALMTGGMSEVVRFVITHWEQIKSAFSTAIAAVVGFVTKLPGQIMSALAGLPGQLLGLGKSAFQSMWDGINSIIPKLLSLAAGLVKSLVSKLDPRNWFSTPEEHYRMLWGAAFQSIGGEAKGALGGIDRQIGKVIGATNLADAFAMPSSIALPSIGRLGAGIGAEYATSSGISASARQAAMAQASQIVHMTIEGSVIRESEIFDRLRSMGIDLAAVN